MNDGKEKRAPCCRYRQENDLPLTETKCTLTLGDKFLMDYDDLSVQS